MNGQSRVGTASPVLLLALVAAAAASAQPLPQALDGKTCQGTFNSGKKALASSGALQLHFAVAGGQLTAQMWRSVGSDAFDRAAYALTWAQRNAPPLDISGYEALGPVRDLSVAGDTIGYVDPLGARVQLQLKRGDLSGTSDPRGGADRRMTRLQFVNLRCR